MANGNQAQAQGSAAPGNAAPAQAGAPGEEKKPNWIKWVIIALVVIAVIAGIWLLVG